MVDKEKENEVAMFVDFENLRYGMLNIHGDEPDIPSLVAKARKYGRPSLMRAYADFSDHPEPIGRALQVAGVDAINVPSKRSTYKGVERVKNSADMVLALDALMEGVNADKNNIRKTVLLVTGDRDYVKLVTLLRNQFGQRVVIVGVPGTIASDLIKAAGEQDLVEVGARGAADSKEIKRKIVAMVRKGPAPLKYWSLKIIEQWAGTPQHAVPGTLYDKRNAIRELLSEGVLTQQDRLDPRKATTVKETVLNLDAAKRNGYIDGSEQ